MITRRMVLRLGLAAVSFVLTCLVCEGVLRWFAPIGDPFITHTPNLDMVLHPNPRWMPNTISPARFTTDEYGFRVTRPIRYRAKPAKTFRVFLIGGSTTENLYIDDARTFGAILEAKLNDVMRPTGHQAEVINAARAGTGSADHFYLTWRVIDYQPDLIVYLMGANDMGPYLRNGFSPEATELKARVRTSLFRSQIARRVYALFRVTSATGREVRDSTGASVAPELERWRRAPQRPMPEEVRRVPASYRNNVRRLLTLHLDQRLPIVFMTQPVLWHASMAPELRALLHGFLGDGIFRYPTEELERVMDQYNDVLRAAAAAEPLAMLVDLARLLPKNGEIFFDEVHFTDPAQERIAEILFRALLRSSLLK